MNATGNSRENSEEMPTFQCGYGRTVQPHFDQEWMCCPELFQQRVTSVTLRYFVEVHPTLGQSTFDEHFLSDPCQWQYD